MIRALAILLLIILCVNQITPASAHGVARVRKQLKEQGYEQLEFRRRKPPFKLDACLDGERYHLRVDFYGKITKKTAFGSCDGDPDQQEDAEADDNTSTTSQEEQDDSTQESSTSEPEDNDTISDEAAARAMRRWGVDLREKPKN